MYAEDADGVAAAVRAALSKLFESFVVYLDGLGRQDRAHREDRSVDPGRRAQRAPDPNPAAGAARTGPGKEQAAKAAGLALPAAIVAFSPGLDATRTGQSIDSKAGIDPFFTREGLTATGTQYLGGQDPNQPLLSPATLADLTGFPPILLQVGTNELLLDDSVRLADRARDHGVDVILDITAGVPHVLQSYVGVLDESDHAADRAALFLRRQLG